MRLSAETLAVLEFLTWQVRLATDAQVQRMLALSSDAQMTEKNVNVQSVLKRLRSQGLLYRERIHVGVLNLEYPLRTWAPGDPRPALGQLAWKLLVRSHSLQRQRMTVNWATHRAADFMGGTSGQLRQPLQAEHDLGTTSACLGCLARDPKGIWYGEDIIRRRFRDQLRKIPDAVLVDCHDQILKAVEFGGQYSRKHLENFHRSWRRRTTPWEIW